MKRMRLIYAVLLVSVLGGPAAAASVDIAIGGRFWYNWWRPPWADGVTFATPVTPDKPFSTPYRIKHYRINPAPMYGFIVSARFLDTWFFSSSLMISRYSTRSGTPPYGAINSWPLLKNRLDINRYDFDARLGYQANRYFRAFIYFKTKAYDYTLWTRLFQASPSPAYLARSESEFIDVGPGLGIAVTVPLYQNFFMECELAGLVNAGYASRTYDYQYAILDSGVSLILDKFDKESFYSFSGSGSLFLGYRIEPVNITIMAGGRYDISRYMHHRILRGFLDYNHKLDQSWGTTFSVVYGYTATDGQ